MTASDGRHADAALVRRFRQAQTRRNRTAVFADVAAQHGDAVLGRCAERLWPDADAAVAAACDVLVAARLVMADPAKLARPDQLRDWLLVISDGLTSGRPAGTGDVNWADDVNWEAVNARAAAGVPGMRDSPARRAPLRRWLEQIVATLPGPRQRLFDLFVVRGLDSRDAALELGSSRAEVRRLRRENRQAVLRAFEVTALAAAEAAPDLPGSDAPGCGELRQVLADAQRDRGRQEGGPRHTAVLPAALRVTVTRHLSQCGACQRRRDDCMARWAPELLPVLARAELGERVTEGLRAVTEVAGPRDAHRAHRRVASAGTAGMAVARKSAAAAGAGLLAALLLLAFVWPGLLHSTVNFVPRDSAPSSHDPSGGDLSSTGAQPVAGITGGVSGHTRGRQLPPGGAGLVNSLPPQATGSPAVPSSPASPAPPVQPTVQHPTSAPAAEPASESPASPPAALSPSPSATQPTGVPSAPPASPASAPPPATAPSSSPSPAGPASSAPPAATPPPSTASPSASASSIAPSPALTSPAPSPSTTSPSATSPSATSPSATSPTPAPSTPAPGAS